MNNKPSIKDYFMELRALAERANRDDLIQFVDSRIAQVDAKNAHKSTKPTKSAIETADVAEIILANMPVNQKMTATEIQNSIPALVGKSNQRMTAALKVLCSTGLIKNVKEKSKSYFVKA